MSEIPFWKVVQRERRTPPRTVINRHKPSKTVKLQTYRKYASKWSYRQGPSRTVKNRQKPSLTVKHRHNYGGNRHNYGGYRHKPSWTVMFITIIYTHINSFLFRMMVLVAPPCRVLVWGWLQPWLRHLCFWFPPHVWEWCFGFWRTPFSKIT